MCSWRLNLRSPARSASWPCSRCGALLKSPLSILGFAPGGLVVGRVALPGTYATPESQRLFYERLVDQVRALPGVKAAGIVSARPFSGMGPATTVRDATRAPDPNGQDPVADVRLAGDSALDALGVPLERRTAFGARDNAGPGAS